MAIGHRLTLESLKPNTAYMEVPRCEACAYWTAIRSGQQGNCKQLQRRRDPGLQVMLRGAPGTFGLAPARPMGFLIRTAPSFGCVQFEAKE